MRKRDFILFFSAVFTVYSLLNFYIFMRGWQVLDGTPFQVAYLVVFLFLSLSFIAGRVLERKQLSWLSTLLVWTGSFWLAAMVYFLMAVYVIDSIRLFDHFVPIIPDSLSKELAASVVVPTVLVVVLLGHLNTLMPRIKTLALTIPKNSGRLRDLNIAVASDIHLGTPAVRTGNRPEIVNIRLTFA